MYLAIFETDELGRTVLMDMLQPLPHNGGYWARRLRGLAKSYKRDSPSREYFLQQCSAGASWREFYRV